MFVKKVFISVLVCLSMAIAEKTSYLLNFTELGGEQDSLFNGNWKVRLNSSADFVLNRQLCYAKNVAVQGTQRADLFEQGSSGDVLGVRINFPDMPANAFAKVTAPSEIKYFNRGGDIDEFVGKGLIKNVDFDTVKSIKILVKGKNFHHSLYINLRNRDNEVRSYFMGSLAFNGWEELEYKNFNYISDIKFIDFDKQPIIPLYPQEEPYLKIDSISFLKQNDALSGDFIAYVGWIKVEYKGAIVKDDADDINDEETWEILKERDDELSIFEAKRQVVNEELKRRELLKRAIESQPQSQPESQPQSQPQIQSQPDTGAQ